MATTRGLNRAVVAVASAAALLSILFVLSDRADARYPVSPAADHGCRFGLDVPWEDQFNCYALTAFGSFVKEIDAALDQIDERAERFERRAARAGSRRGWRVAVRERAAAIHHTRLARLDVRDAYRDFLAARVPLAQLRSEELGRVDQMVRAYRRSIDARIRLMQLQLAADLLRARRPAGPPALGGPTAIARRRAQAAATALATVTRVTGRRPSTYPAGGEAREIWQRHGRRNIAITQAITRHAIALGKATSSAERRARVDVLRVLLLAYRRETAQVRARVAASGGACSDLMLRHFGNQTRRQVALTQYISAVRRGNRTAANAARDRYRKLGRANRALARTIRRCLATTTTPPGPSPTPIAPPGDKLPARTAATSAAVCPATVTDTGGKTRYLVRTGVRANLVSNPAPADGNPTRVDCWYTLNSSGASDGSAASGITFTMLFPDDGLSAPSSGACGGRSNRSGFRVSTAFYLDAWVTNLAFADKDGLAARALAMAEGAGIAIPCTWTGN